MLDTIIEFFKALFSTEPIPEPKPTATFDLPESVPLDAPALEGPGAEFLKALPFILKSEGGYVNHPADKGGPTNKGITLGTLARYRGKPVTAADVKALKDVEIQAIYKKFYWDTMNLDKIADQGIATAMFDMGVLCGTGTSSMWAQRICGVKDDGDIGPVSLVAINAMTKKKFIPLFQAIALDHFKKIVATRPSQKVFLNGWTNRANRLSDLAKSEEPTAVVPATNAATGIGKGLLEMATKYGLPHNRIAEMISFQEKSRPTSDPRYWAMFDISKHSKLTRLAIMDRVSGEVDFYHVAHGKASDPDNNGVATVFSNVSGSNCSSLGIYRCAETYVSGKFGRALRLDGKEPSNSNARARAVVFHGSDYVGKAYVDKTGKCGRSLGCPAVDHAVAQMLIDKLKDGSLLYIYNGAA